MPEKKYNWYIVKCPTGVENKFISEFQEILEKLKSSDLLIDFFLPVTSQHKSNHRRAVMANYVFIKIAYDPIIEKAFERIAYASLMRDTSLNVVEVDEETVANLKEKEALEAVREQQEAKLKIEDEITVLEGPFTDFNGTIKKIKEDENIVSVSVIILGNPIQIELPFTAIKRRIIE